MDLCSSGRGTPRVDHHKELLGVAMHLLTSQIPLQTLRYVFVFRSSLCISLVDLDCRGKRLPRSSAAHHKSLQNHQPHCFHVPTLDRRTHARCRAVRWADPASVASQGSSHFLWKVLLLTARTELFARTGTSVGSKQKQNVRHWSKLVPNHMISHVIITCFWFLVPF